MPTWLNNSERARWRSWRLIQKYKGKLEDAHTLYTITITLRNEKGGYDCETGTHRMEYYTRRFIEFSQKHGKLIGGYWWQETPWTNHGDYWWAHSHLHVDAPEFLTADALTRYVYGWFELELGLTDEDMYIFCQPVVRCYKSYRHMLNYTTKRDRFITDPSTYPQLVREWHEVFHKGKRMFHTFGNFRNKPKPYDAYAERKRIWKKYGKPRQKVVAESNDAIIRQTSPRPKFTKDGPLWLKFQRKLF